MTRINTYRDRWERVTLQEMYIKYPYKWKDINSATVPLPYFPAKDITDTEYSMSYKQWKTLVNLYFKLVIEYMQEGLAYDLPQNLGNLHVKKVKGSGIDWDATKKKYGSQKGQKEIKKVYMDNTYTDGYYPIVKWYRLDKLLKYKWLWDFKPTQICKKVAKHWNEDNSNVYKISDV
jgi:hypothetical protein